MLHSDAASGRRNVFHKVQAVEGDLTEPGLGLSDADAQLLKDEVVIILHCGASIELDADVQKTLTYVLHKSTDQLVLAALGPEAFVC
jgi:hypothetical protein